MLAPRIGIAGPRWTEHAALPGGDIPRADFDAFAARMAGQYPWLNDPLRLRYARAYGTRMTRLLEHCSSVGDLGEEILPQLYSREVDYLRREEWAQTAEDILWRRTKLGLGLPVASARTLDEWIAAHPLEPRAATA